MKKNNAKESCPISARVPLQVYQELHSLCNERDCTASEFIGALVNKALEDRMLANEIMKAIELQKIEAYKSIGITAIEQQLKAAERTVRKLTIALQAMASK